MGATGAIYRLHRRNENCQVKTFLLIDLICNFPQHTNISAYSQEAALNKIDMCSEEEKFSVFLHIPTDKLFNFIYKILLKVHMNYFFDLNKLLGYEKENKIKAVCLA